MTTIEWEGFLMQLLQTGDALDICDMLIRQFEEAYGSKPQLVTFNVSYSSAFYKAMMARIVDLGTCSFPIMLDGVLVTPDNDIKQDQILRVYSRTLAKVLII